MLPIPCKSHYTFNICDVSKVIQGVMSLHKAHIDQGLDVIAVWYHEGIRVFSERLDEKADVDMFNQMNQGEILQRFEKAPTDLYKTEQNM